MRTYKLFKALLLGVICIANACTPDKITYYDNDKVEFETLTGIKLRSNHYQVLADGRAELELTPILLKTKDSIRVLEDRMKQDWVEYHEKSGVEVDRYFSTSDPELIGKTLKVWASIKGTDMESDTITFTVKEPLADDAYEPVTFPIVFHVMQTKEDIEARGGNISSIFIERAIERLNNVFSGRVSRNANGVDTKIRFKAAEYAPDGTMLAEPGINRLPADYKTISYGDDEHEWFIRDLDSNIPSEDRDDYVIPEDGNNVFWPHDKYFQIWLISDDDNEKFGFKVAGNCYPTSVYSDVDSDTYPKMLLLTQNEGNIFPAAKYKGVKYRIQDFMYVGARTHKIQYSTFKSEETNDLMYYVGQYFGLLPTYQMAYADKPFWGMWYSSKQTDYCSDTFFTYGYEGGYLINTSSEMHKTVNGHTYYFLGENIMDGPGGLHRSISKEQTARIRWIIKNCPERQAWKSDFAFTGIGD